MVLHTGLAPVHIAELVLEHSPHVPSGWHAGAFGSVQCESSLQG
jgi:hypothetical protein